MLTEEAIVEQIQADPEMMKVLAIIRDLNLTDAWLAAGAVRNFIWNQLSGKPGFDATTDLDLVFYDPTISYEETQQIEQELQKTYPQYAWEVKNQVYMHQHSPGTAPYRSACDAVSKYPEQCTALTCSSLEERWSARALSPLWDKGYRRLHRSANSAFFSQSRAFSGLYRADKKEGLAE